ncbi:MAG: HD domain-containing protein [Mangrovicoccus sp.]|nr:HD domain-containing protein [Mangrovicoccus sp.]
MSQNITELTRALAYAARAHANQRRKGAAQEPYINHLIEVMDLVAGATGGEDTELLIAALMHDVIEDTAITAEELTDAFGPRVTRIVQANSDDMTLPKAERKRQRIANMAHKAADARIVKIADVISNVRAVVISGPAGWTAEWKLNYLKGCRDLVDAGRGANATLEAIFDATANEAERAILEEDDMAIEGRREAVRHLDNAIGQSVFRVYLANTTKRDLTRADLEQLAKVSAERFPSCTIEQADAIFDGELRPILTARIRTDNQDAVVAYAQALCLVFDQDFVGIEVGGRYIRVYADDTG